MKFILLMMCLFGLLKSHTFQGTDAVKKIENFHRSRTHRPTTKHIEAWETDHSTRSYRTLDGSDCAQACLWNSYCDHYSGKCLCYRDSISVGNGCYRKGDLGDHCIYYEQCQTPNSYCKLGTCSCKEGFGKSGYQCFPKTKENRPTFTTAKENTLIIILSVISAIIVCSAIIVSAIILKRKLSDTCSRRTQNNAPHRSHESTLVNISWSSRYPEILRLESRTNTTETILEDLDKPPSYEEIVTASKSMCNLMNYQVSPDEPCPTYRTAMRIMRTRSSSM